MLDSNALCELVSPGQAPSVANAEQILHAAELSAAATATIAPEARQVIDACRSSGRKVVLFSTHSSDAVEAVLGLSGLRPLVGPVIGRNHVTAISWDFRAIADLVRVTVQETDEQPANCAVVGLSVATMYAARETGARGIGVVNEHANRKHLAIFDAAVVGSLPALAAALTTVPPNV